MEKVYHKFNMKDIAICYGMTETSPVNHMTNTSDSLTDRCTTVGTLMEHLECKLVDEQNRPVPLGSPGEVCVRGYSVMTGYYNDQQKTDEIMKNGWLSTGDLATMDSRGYLTIIGRKKDMIIRGGENISPKEIEEYLLRMPGV